MNAKEKMLLLLDAFDRGFNGVDIDVNSDDPQEDWTCNYASAVLDVSEPDDDVRRYFDTDGLMNDLIGHIAKHFKAERKPGAKIRLVIGSEKAKPKPGECILHIRRRDSWSLGIECYRERKKTERK
jgi:hypothetical protein